MPNTKEAAAAKEAAEKQATEELTALCDGRYTETFKAACAELGRPVVSDEQFGSMMKIAGHLEMLEQSQAPLVKKASEDHTASALDALLKVTPQDLAG